MSPATTSSAQGYPPSKEFAAQANATAEMYDRADADRLEFWAEQARRLDWDTDFDQVLDWSGAPFAKWFVGGTLNVAVNCVDRHVAAGKGERVAIHWVGEPGDSRDLTYAQLQDEVSKAANYFSAIGLVAGVPGMVALVCGGAISGSKYWPAPPGKTLRCTARTSRSSLFSRLSSVPSVWACAAPAAVAAQNR